MKKLLQLGAICCCLLMSQYGYSFGYNQDSGSAGILASDGGYAAQGGYSDGAIGAGDQGQAYSAADGQDGCCPQDCPADQPLNDCWCLYAHYEPCYYKCWRCVEEPQYYTKKCCRMCPKYYQCQKCRYVPQYYCETYCKQCPEYYDVQECRTCKKWVCDTKCKYVPKYYYKHTCGQPDCQNQCPAGGCAR